MLDIGNIMNIGSLYYQFKRLIDNPRRGIYSSAGACDFPEETIRFIDFYHCCDGVAAIDLNSCFALVAFLTGLRQRPWSLAISREILRHH
jgi:hypothetical protein